MMTVALFTLVPPPNPVAMPGLPTVVALLLETVLASFMVSIVPALLQQ